MKKMLAILQATIVLLLASCGGAKTENEGTTDTTVAATTADTATKIAPVTAPAFQPFKVAMVKIKVKDFTKWKTQYASGDSLRKAYGFTHLGTGRTIADSNVVFVAYKIDDVAKAKEFGKSPQLKARMQKGGVIGPRVASYIDVIRDEEPGASIKDRVYVTHKVKDFDSWLKGYDAEGKEARAAHGMVDIGLGRGIDDPNMVYLLFGVTDMEKAKARANSPELKKIMTDAGVVGKPELVFYREVE